MATQRRMQFVHGQVAWMVTVILALSLLEALSYELFFVLSLVGLLIVAELTASITVTPIWRTRLRWLIITGLVVFGLVVTRRILEMLPPEVLPW